MFIKIKKLFTVLIISSIILTPFKVYADDSMSPPPPPDAPSAPSVSDVVPPAPPSPLQSPNEVQPQSSNSQQSNIQTSPVPTGKPIQDAISTGNPNNIISSGNAGTSGTVPNIGNTNLSTGTQPGNASLVNSGNGVISDQNGAGSTNDSTVNQQTTNKTTQNNTATTESGLTLSSATGSNNASQNVGNSEIKTQNANVTGTVITALNSNVSGVAVSEFNISDNHRGDVVLDFGANCVAGCANSEVNSANTQNGARSQNGNVATNVISSDTFQSNNAVVGSTLNLSANSGSNIASQNTGGNTNVTTGNANVSANSLTLANNNIAGKIIYGVINIFGNLVGDIILPSANTASSPFSSSENSGNGSGSTNQNSVTNNEFNSVAQTNSAVIGNSLNLSATTGGNNTDQNTGGNSSVTTGGAAATAHVLNVANTNVSGGDVWLVLVNKAGEWFGQIIGAPQGQNFAGSAGLGMSVDSHGGITASNNQNGVSSQNSTTSTSGENSSTTQKNSANITNSLNLSANTGDNIASQNTGGDSKVTTGNANIVANLVNFVNNNISGQGRLIVTVVNVFGSWVGDFVTPGNTKKSENPTVSSSPANPGSIGAGSILNSSQGNSQVSSPSLIQQITSKDSGTGQNTQSNNGPVSSANTTKPGSTVTGSDPAIPSQVSAFVENSLNNPNILAAHEQLDNKISNKTLNVNLAWLVVLLPLLGIIFVLRKILRG